jgi:hypothetical protein
LERGCNGYCGQSPVRAFLGVSGHQRRGVLLALRRDRRSRVADEFGNDVVAFAVRPARDGLRLRSRVDLPTLQRELDVGLVQAEEIARLFGKRPLDLR